MRSQKTEVIQVQCANRGTEDTEKNTRPKRFQQLFLFLLPVELQGGHCEPGILGHLVHLGFPLSSPGLGGSKGPQNDSAEPSLGQYLDPDSCAGVHFSRWRVPLETDIPVLPLDNEPFHGFLLLRTELRVLGICVCVVGPHVFS